MPLPKPRKGEERDAFISRCMGDDLMNKEYPDNKQRAAVCYNQWRAKLKNQQYKVLTTNNYVIRTETHQGRKHLVVPVVMMVEGVHNGSAGPLLHTQDELGKFPAAWNGIPVVIGHPEENGQLISANSPKVIDQSVIGRVYNSRMEDAKLKGEVWADVEKLKQTSPLAYAYIMQQKPLDVSVGVFSDDETTSGEWDGKDYVAIARNYRPDHLALLPEGTGACSWLDGCGVRVNTEGLLEAVNLVKDKLYSLDSNTNSYYLEEVYDDGIFIYKKSGNGKEKYYRGTYQIKDGEVQFGNDEEEVTKEVKYKKVITMQETKNNRGGIVMNKVKELLTTAPSIYTEDDNEWLEKLEEEQLDKLITCAKTSAEATAAKDAVEEEKVKANERIIALESEVTELKKGTLQINEEAAMKILKEKISDMKTFGELLPDEFKKQFEYGQKLYTAHRQELIQHILDNQAEKVWDEESLKKKDDDDLQKTAEAIKKPVDYSASGGGAASGFFVNTNEEILLPPGVETEKK